MLIRSFRGGIRIEILSYITRHTAIVRMNGRVDLNNNNQVIALVGVVAVEVSGDPLAMMDVLKPTARQLGDGLYEVTWEWEKRN